MFQKKNRIWLIGAIIVGLMIGWTLTGKMKKRELNDILEPNLAKAEQVYSQLGPYSKVNLDYLVLEYCHCLSQFDEEEVLDSSEIQKNALALQNYVNTCIGGNLRELSTTLDEDLAQMFNLNNAELEAYRMAMIMNFMEKDCPQYQEAAQVLLKRKAVVIR